MAEASLSDGPRHLPELKPCPFLPDVAGPLTAASVNALGDDRGPAFYEAALRYAASLWLQGLPARAILLLNRALGADVPADSPVLRKWPLPYAAVAWILRHARPEHFLGNPRRHWQHLATRMAGPRPELRTWRAWACWRLARLILPGLPADELQLAEEAVREPEEVEIFARLECLGLPGEAALWAEICVTFAAQDEA